MSLSPWPRIAAPVFAALVAAALLGGSAAPLRADEPGGAPGTVEIRFDTSLTVPEFLRTVSQAVGRPFLWADGDKNLTGRRLASTGSLVVPRAKALDAARALLVTMELVLIPLGPEGAESYYVVNAREQMSLLRLKPVSVDVTDENVSRLEKQDGLFVSAVIRVREMDNLRDARQGLSRLVTQNNIGQVTEVPGARAFIVTDFAPAVAAIYRVLRQMDVRPARESATVQEFIRLRHANAVDVQAILEEQVGPRGKAPTAGPAAVEAAAAAEDAPRISADRDTNQLVITCLEAALAKIRRIVEALDVEPPSSGK